MTYSDRIAAVIIALLFALLVGGLAHATRPTAAQNADDRSIAHLL